MTLFLIGLTGSGKSTVGRLLAEKLGWEFCDSDEEVLRLVQRDRPEIGDLLTLYARVPNDEFRVWEHKALESLSKRDNAVVATGGGFVEHGPSLELMRAQKLVVHLDCPVEVLARRISAMPPRPMFQGTTILEKLTELRSRGEALYRSVAKTRVEADAEPSDVAATIVGAVVR